MGAVQPIVVPQSLAYVLNNAGDKSNVDFSYLVDTAQRESALNPNAKASGSSATGLFQFLDSSWLQVMKEEGPRLGYQKYADAITTDKDGDYVIKDKALRTKILALRQDPQVAADMAAAYTQSNGDYLKDKFGRMPSPGELYIAHFLGPQGAEKLFKAGLDNPDQVAAKLFPNQAKANPQIFYQDGHSRTIREVYKALVAKHDGIVASPVPDAAPDPKFSTHLLASGDAASKWSTEEVPSRFTKADMSFTSLFATQKPTGVPQPLLGSEAAQPLIDGYGKQAVSLVAPQAAPVPYPAPARPADPGQPLALMSPDQVIPPEPLQAIDNAMSGEPDDDSGGNASIGDPFDAPTPLLGTGPAAAATAPLALMADGTTDPQAPAAADLGMPAEPELQPPPPDNGLPQGRVLMSPGTHQPNAAFFTQLLTQTRF